MEFAPVKLKPLFKSRIWGSDLFKSIFQFDGSDPIGECLQFVDDNDSNSIISGGTFDGNTFRWLLQEYCESYGFTSSQCEDHFGLLAKYLDVNDILSLQVSPDSNICEKYSLNGSRVVCWYIVDAKDDSYVYVGLKDGVTRSDMEAAIANGTVADLLQKKPAKKGDFFYIPAGTVNAPGAGLLVAEIGTSSQSTFRLHDWNRKGPQGQQRQLHVEQALDSIYFEDSFIPDDMQSSFLLQGALDSVTEMIGDARPLVDCPYFSVAEVKGNAQSNKFKTAMPLLILPVSGRAILTNTSRPEEAVELEFGSGVIMPATQHGHIEYQEDTVLLVFCPGPVKMGK